MARALSDDLRHRVLAASAGGMSARSAAARLMRGHTTQASGLLICTEK
ncbi:hypothetical protein GHK30_05060 [Sinorhizobium medicae]|nr:hypothetical protein [Sinorhizobium medicae]